MSHLPLRPEINRLLNVRSMGLPIGTTLKGYELEEDDMVQIVFFAVQPSMAAGVELKASVRVEEVALSDFGVGPAVDAVLKVLLDLVWRRALPSERTGSPAPLVATIGQSGLRMHQPPIAFPAEF